MDRIRLSYSAISISIVLLILAVVIGDLEYWLPGGGLIFPARRFYILPAALLLLLGVAIAPKNILSFKPNILLISSGLFVFFFSSWMHNDYGLIHAVDGRGLIILFSLIALGLFLADIKINWSLCALSLLALLVVCFLVEANGRLITSDDHLTFLHRLQLLKSNFPNIPNYDPLWNGGYDQRYYFATGALAFYFICWPLIAFFEPITVYNFCVILVGIILPFASVYLAARTLKCSVNASWIAAILSLAPCAEWYRWILQYGTMGFITSSARLPLA